MLKFVLLFFLGSCSFFIDKIDTQLVDSNEIAKKIPSPITYCPVEQPTTIQLVGTNENSQNTYLELSRNLKSQNLDFFDHFALWSLVQLSIRPDQSSATSRFQILFHYKEKSYYFDFFSEKPEDQYPYFYGIEWVLKKFGKKQKLEHYVKFLQSAQGQKFKIGKDFENFLVKNQVGIKASPELNTHYFRGTEILKEDESTPKLDYTSIIKNYRKSESKQQIIVNTYLTPFVTGKGQSGSCNYDFNLYDNSIFLIDKVIPVANLFGLSLPHSAFMASSSQKMETITSLLGSPLFKGDSKVRSSAVCVIENGDSKIWTFSNQSRDPGQHLFHLVRYGLPQTKNTSEVDRLMRHSRHLFLSDPVRLVIESNRSREDQIENLLKLNLPIYNADHLGNIWSYTFFGKQNRFIIDDRNPGAFSCK